MEGTSRRSRMRWSARMPALAVAATILIVYASISYHDRGPGVPRSCADVDPAEVVAAARSIEGTLYDPLKGSAGDLGGTLGFVVCTDVCVIAYKKCGVSISDMLVEDFRRSPEAYDPRGDNGDPESPYFSRRARNIFVMCRNRDRLLPEGARPRAADLVFFEKSPGSGVAHIALVGDVAADGSYSVIEAAPSIVLVAEVRVESVLARGWRIVGIGRLID